MTKKKYHRKRQKPFPIIPFVLGLLLVVFGILAMSSPKSNSYTESASSSVVPMAVNYAAPELSLQNISGETKSLADYRNNVVLVNNWATWCPPCKAEMPTLSAYYNEHGADGFMVIAIEAGDPLESVSQFATAYNLKSRFGWIRITQPWEHLEIVICPTHTSLIVPALSAMRGRVRSAKPCWKNMLHL